MRIALITALVLCWTTGPATAAYWRCRAPAWLKGPGRA